MLKIYIALIVFFYSSCVFSTEFKLASFNRYGESPSLELWLYPDNANTLDEIFDVLKFSRDEIYVRLVGESSEVTNVELLQYYKNKAPDLLNNLNKNYDRLRSLFIPAFKSTTLYKELAEKLKFKGYFIKNISFEKLIFSPLSIPDVYIECSKKGDVGVQ